MTNKIEIIVYSFTLVIMAIPPPGLILAKGASYSDFIQKNTVIINDKLAQFLSKIYLGPLFEESGPKEPLQTYLNFLNPYDPSYKITTKFLLTILLWDIYPVANNLMCVGFSRRIGTCPATEVKDYFQEEYAIVIKRYAEHQEKFNEIEGDYQQYSMRNGLPTIIHGKHLTLNTKPKLRPIWRFPREYSLSFMGKIINNNTEKYCVTDNLDNWIEEVSALYTILKYSRTEINKHPEIITVAVKSAIKQN